MKPIKTTIIIMTITLSFCIFISGTASAQNAAVTAPLAQEMGDPKTAVEQEGPALTTPAAAQRAENLAEASASEARAEILKARKSAAKAKAALKEARNSGKRTDLDEVQARYDAALQSLDRVIANSTGITIDEISAMRSSGMECEQIAYELGVNPSALGLDDTKAKKANEMEMATARNVETELSMWHGTRFNGKGMGLDRAESKKGVGNGTDGKVSDSDSGRDIFASTGEVLVDKNL